MVIEHKEKLVNDKAALELLQSEAHDTLTDYKVQISLIDQKLADLGKPEVTPAFLDKVYETILEGVENIDLEDGLDCDFEIDYDNRVTMSNPSFSDNGKIADAIYQEVQNLFAEAECPEK